MNTTYLDYYKQILEKVSFDSHLFRREYQKASKKLGVSEKEELNKWLQARGLGYHVLQFPEYEVGDLPVRNLQYYRLWSSM
jgi:hypothetical protein